MRGTRGVYAVVTSVEAFVFLVGRAILFLSKYPLPKA